VFPRLKSKDHPNALDYAYSHPDPESLLEKKGAEIVQLKQDVEKMISQDVIIDIQEIRKPELDAQLVAENIALQIVRRVAFRRAMKRGIQSAMRFGAQGVKVMARQALVV